MDIHIQSECAWLDPSWCPAHTVLMSTAGFLTGDCSVVCMVGGAKHFLGSRTLCVLCTYSATPWQAQIL